MVNRTVMDSSKKQETDWFVYILRCADDTLYTGITTDLERRLEEHNKGKGARYTSSRIPVTMVYSREAADRSEASRIECELKRLPRSRKLQLISKHS